MASICYGVPKVSWTAVRDNNYEYHLATHRTLQTTAVGVSSSLVSWYSVLLNDMNVHFTTNVTYKEVIFTHALLYDTVYVHIYVLCLVLQLGCTPLLCSASFSSHDNTQLHTVGVWTALSVSNWCIVLYCIVLCCIVLCCIVLYCTVLYCIVLYCTVLYCTVLYCTVLYCIVLYCIVFYCMKAPTVPCWNFVSLSVW